MNQTNSAAPLLPKCLGWPYHEVAGGGPVFAKDSAEHGFAKDLPTWMRRKSNSLI
jgi:hypothetical protein